MCEGYQLVPIRESRGLHPAHPAHQRVAQMKLGWIRNGGVWFNSRGELVKGMIDPMALQASMILRSALEDMRVAS